jgi:hypothetical protein
MGEFPEQFLDYGFGNPEGKKFFQIKAIRKEYNFLKR